MPIPDQFKSSNLGLSYIAPSQAQKHVTVNESLRLLDAVVQLSVLDKDLTTAPTTPNDGDRFIISAGATGDWVDKDNNVAAFQDGAWAYFAPRTGWVSHVADEGENYQFDGVTWMKTEKPQDLSLGTTIGGSVTSIRQTVFDAMGQADFKYNDNSVKHPISLRNEAISVAGNGIGIATYLNSASQIGILSSKIETLATEDYTSSNNSSARIVISTLKDNVIGEVISIAKDDLIFTSDTTLFNHTGNGVQTKLNKNTVSDTASFLFQTGFSGRAEIGLTGDDDFHFKVSPDGSTWIDALTINKDSGFVAVGGHVPTEGLDVRSGDVLIHNSTPILKLRATSDAQQTRIYFGDTSSDTSGIIAYDNASDSLRLQTNSAERVRITKDGDLGIGKTTPTTKLDVDGPIRPKSYTVATLASAASHGAGAIIYVSDEIGGAVLAFSDGTNWRRVTDRVVVS